MLPRYIHIVPRLLYHNLIYAVLYHVSLVLEEFCTNKVLVTTSLSCLQFNVLFLVGNHCCPCCCYFNFFFKYINIFKYNKQLVTSFLLDSCHFRKKRNCTPGVLFISTCLDQYSLSLNQFINLARIFGGSVFVTFYACCIFYRSNLISG